MSAEFLIPLYLFPFTCRDTCKTFANPTRQVQLLLCLSILYLSDFYLCNINIVLILLASSSQRWLLLPPLELEAKSLPSMSLFANLQLILPLLLWHAPLPTFERTKWAYYSQPSSSDIYRRFLNYLVLAGIFAPSTRFTISNSGIIEILVSLSNCSGITIPATSLYHVFCHKI